MSFSLLCYSLLITAALHAQEPVTVKGIIKTESGEPLSGVSIVVKGTSNGTTTKADGAFEIKAPVNSILSISMVGYVNKEIKVGKTGQTDLAITLSSDKLEMDKVVVVGYGTRLKSDITGSIVSISEQSHTKMFLPLTWLQPYRVRALVSMCSAAAATANPAQPQIF